MATKSRKHRIYTRFPKDRNCDVSLRTKTTKAPCRRRTGEVLPRAEKFGDLITADHKVLNEGCEPRDSSRYAVVVQDLATQWIQSCPCKTKTSHETERSLSKFLEPSHRPKVVYTGNSMEFWRAGEDLSWNHRTSTPHRSETNGIAERAVRRVTEGTSAASLQNGLDERWSDSVACYCYLRNVQDLLADVKTPYERRFVEPKGQQYLLKQWLNIIRFRRETSQGSTNLARTYYQESFLAMSWSRGKLERGYSDSRSGRFGKVGSVRNLSSMNQRERSMDKTNR